VSVVIPVHNGARYLPEAIASARAQSAPPHELIVVDDGSTDGSGDLARSLGASCLRQEHAGGGPARNAGARAAVGDAIAFLDSDDLWAPTKLELQAAALEANDELDGVLCHARQFVSPDLTEEERARVLCPEYPQPGALPSALLVRKASFDRTGGYSSRFPAGEFIDWYARATELGLGFTMLPDVLLKRRIHRTNTVRERREELGFTRIVKEALDRRRGAEL
jgi:glycosyltransferase involved in cell wall biosynthesis